MEDERGDDEYDYEYDEEDIDEDDMPAGMNSGGGVSTASDRGAGGSSSVSAEDDIALRDEAVVFVDQTQLKAIMDRLVADIRLACAL